MVQVSRADLCVLARWWNQRYQVWIAASPGSIDNFWLNQTYIFYLNWLEASQNPPSRCLGRGWSVLIWQVAHSEGPGWGMNGKDLFGALDALAMWAGHFVSQPGKMVRPEGHDDNLMGSELVPQLWQRGGREVTGWLDGWIADILPLTEVLKIVKYSKHTKNDRK